MMNEKTWYQSRAAWGAIAALCATLIRISGHDPGLDGAQLMVDAGLNIATGLGALVALYGRIAATSRITR
jgi:hypothetical protein